MKFTINFLARDGLLDYLVKEDPDYLDKDDVCLVGSENYTRKISLSKNKNYLEFWVDIKFTKKELTSLKAFRLVTNKNPMNTDKDGGAYFDYKDELFKKVKKGDNYLKYIDKCFVSNNVIKANVLQIFGISGFELPLITVAAKRLLEAEGCNKYVDFLAVTNLTANSERDDVFFMRPKFSYGEFARDSSVKSKEIDGIQYSRPNGCLSYETDELDKNFPIALTSENLYHSGNVIVSSEFVALLNKLKIKGLKYWPVLEKPSELYTEYLDTWEMILKDISVNSKNMPLHSLG